MVLHVNHFEVIEWRQLTLYSNTWGSGGAEQVGHDLMWCPYWDGAPGTAAIFIHIPGDYISSNLHTDDYKLCISEDIELSPSICNRKKDGLIKRMLK